MSPARRTKRKKKPAAEPPRSQTRVEVVSGDRSGRLGSKHACFSCGAKFYDLNKPEAVCPRCETNQLDKPAEPKVKPAARQAKKASTGRDITPLLAEEEPPAAPADGAEEDGAIGTKPEKSFLEEPEEAAREDED